MEGGEVSYKEVEEDDIDVFRAEIDAKKMAEIMVTRDYQPLQNRISPWTLTAQYLRDTGFQQPILIPPGVNPVDTRKALGIMLPSFDLTVDSIVKTIGPGHPVNIIDVATQMTGPAWSLGQWCNYFNKPPELRKRLFNVVSLELAGTHLAPMVTPPTAVREIELIGQVWPKTDTHRPEVLLYALMGVQGCVTDFHVDFGGSSVWYHVVSGKKIFLLVPPTEANIDQFEKWSSCSAQFSMFYGDLADNVMRVELEKGYTMLIPAGWPHAVVTPEDSVVVGGNFLHGLDMSRQLSVWRLEQRLKVRDQFRFPKYKILMCHTAVHYTQILKAMVYPGTAVAEIGHQPLLECEVKGLWDLVDMLKLWDRNPQALIQGTTDVIKELEEVLIAFKEKCEKPTQGMNPLPRMDLLQWGRKRDLDAMDLGTPTKMRKTLLHDEYGSSCQDKHVHEDQRVLAYPKLGRSMSLENQIADPNTSMEGMEKAQGHRKSASVCEDQTGRFNSYLRALMPEDESGKQSAKTSNPLSGCYLMRASTVFQNDALTPLELSGDTSTGPDDKKDLRASDLWVEGQTDEESELDLGFPDLPCDSGARRQGSIERKPIEIDLESDSGSLCIEDTSKQIDASQQSPPEGHMKCGETDRTGGLVSSTSFCMKPKFPGQEEVEHGQSQVEGRAQEGSAMNIDGSMVEALSSSISL